MKRLLLPLLAALALPTAVNAEVVNLECESTYLDWNESRKLDKNEIVNAYIDIDLDNQTSSINEKDFITKFNTFITRDSFVLTYLDTERKEKDQITISRVDGSFVRSYEKLQLNKESVYFNEKFYNLVKSKNEKLLEPMRISGKCKKAKKIKTIF